MPNKRYVIYSSSTLSFLSRSSGVVACLSSVVGTVNGMGLVCMQGPAELEGAVRYGPQGKREEVGRNTLIPFIHLEPTFNIN